MWTMNRILTIVLMTNTFQTVFSFPITPQTLKKLIENSQCIVVATVDNPKTKVIRVKYFNTTKNDTVVEFKKVFTRDGLADLYLNEILKGNPGETHIQVTYSENLICPAPPNYPHNMTVLAFLNQVDSSPTYLTVGLSYGSKIMNSEEELNSYRTRIYEYLEILNMTDKRNKNEATVEWLVKCCENKFTRWEGSQELSRQGGFMSFNNRSKDPQLYKKISKSQLQRLDSAFFATDTIGYDDLCLANLISKKSNLRLKKYLLNNLYFADYYIADDIMKKIIEIDSNKELRLIYKEVDKIEFGDKEKVGKQKMLIDKFIEVANRK